MDAHEATMLLARADLIHSAATVVAAISRVAREITVRLRDRKPLLLCVMKGGLPFAGQLMTQLSFPLDVDYVDVSRYGEATVGGTRRRAEHAPREIVAELDQRDGSLHPD